MYIQKVRLTNFRCFKEKTLTFDRGFNVITAPNGSGKTCCVEAIGFALMGSDLLRDPIRKVARRDSLGRSGVVLVGTTGDGNFEVRRFLSPRTTELILPKRSTRKTTEVNEYFGKLFVNPRTFKASVLCFQRETTMLAAMDSVNRRKFISSLLQLDVIEKAVNLLQGSSMSIRQLETQLSNAKDELEKLPQVPHSEEILRERLYLLRQLERYQPEVTEKRAALTEKLHKLTTLEALLKNAVAFETPKCPVCGGDWNPDEAKALLLRVVSELTQTRRELQQLPPTLFTDVSDIKRKLDTLPNLSTWECNELLSVLQRRRVLGETTKRLESAIEEAKRGEVAAKARKLLRDFYVYEGTPSLRWLSQVTRQLLSTTPYKDFQVTPEMEFTVDGYPLTELSTGQQDFVMTIVRIALSKVITLSRGLEPLPLVLDSIGDALDEEHFEMLVEMLGSPSLGAQIIMTTHREVSLPTATIIRL